MSEYKSVISIYRDDESISRRIIYIQSNDEGENIDICEILSSDPSIVMTSELFAEARRSYYQVDEVLDSLIDSL